ncbi:MAG TPA: amidohydrolase family protein [Stellaceae bacterium]|jgi:predicted TIM-barrel fold metal-dependent hydrolase|nr:amidohydrolase family protein [Stellaceae bacterium]
MQSSSSAPQRHLPIRKDWLAATQESALEPDRPIIDPHHHLWDRPGSRYLLHDLVEDLSSGHNIRATVFLECREMYRGDGPPELRSLGETTFVTGVSAMSESGKYGPSRACAGIIGNVDFRVGSRAKGILEQHIVASGGRFRGIRNGATWHSDERLRVFTSGSGEGLYVNSKWREGFAALAPLNLTFEAWMFHSQLGELVSLAAAFPETKIVVNHIGGALAVGPYADKRKEVFDEWRSQIMKLGQYPNVYIKLGGLGMPSLMGFEMGQQEKAPSSEQLAKAWKPYLETCIEAFGPDRGMFESNFPVDKGMCSYANLWNAFKRVSANYSNDEKNKMFHDTALKFYRLW